MITQYGKSTSLDCKPCMGCFWQGLLAGLYIMLQVLLVLLLMRGGKRVENLEDLSINSHEAEEIPPDPVSIVKVNSNLMLFSC